eukprot:1829781-Alexandrium_andersonii.AAC.1
MRAGRRGSNDTTLITCARPPVIEQAVHMNTTPLRIRNLRKNMPQSAPLGSFGDPFRGLSSARAVPVSNA